MRRGRVVVMGSSCIPRVRREASSCTWNATAAHAPSSWRSHVRIRVGMIWRTRWLIVVLESIDQHGRSMSGIYNLYQWIWVVSFCLTSFANVEIITNGAFVTNANLRTKYMRKTSYNKYA